MKPFVTAVDDYHDFALVVNHFKNAGIKLAFKEIGCFFSDLSTSCYCQYHAVFFEPKDRNSKAVKDIFEKWRAIEEGNSIERII